MSGKLSSFRVQVVSVQPSARGGSVQVRILEPGPWSWGLTPASTVGGLPIEGIVYATKARHPDGRPMNEVQPLALKSGVDASLLNVGQDTIVEHVVVADDPGSTCRFMYRWSKELRPYWREEWDRQALDELRAGGADLTKSYVFSHRFYADARRTAEAIGGAGTDAGYDATRATQAELEGKPTWHVCLEGACEPLLELVHRETKVMQDIADRHGAFYEGWSAEPLD